jgi:hypothetical protein
MIVPAMPDAVVEPPDAPAPLPPASPAPPLPPPPAPEAPGGTCASDVHATAQRHAAACAARMKAGPCPSISRIDPDQLARGIAIRTCLAGGPSVVHKKNAYRRAGSGAISGSARLTRGAQVM